MGRHDLELIGYSAGEYQKVLEEFQPTGDRDKDLEVFDSRLGPIMKKSSDLSLQWRHDVIKRLGSRLPHYYTALFDSDAGLVPAKPPARLTDEHWQRERVEHEMRLQRLHQIIADLSAEFMAEFKG